MTGPCHAQKSAKISHLVGAVGFAFSSFTILCRIVRGSARCSVTSALFPRNFRKTYPQAVRGEGCYIITADGRRILDAAGSAAVVSIGHGVASVGRAMAEQSSQIAFAHTSQFQTDIAERLINHVNAVASDVELIYDLHKYLPEMRNAVEAYEAHLAALLATPQQAEAA